MPGMVVTRLAVVVMRSVIMSCACVV